MQAADAESTAAADIATAAQLLPSTIAGTATLLAAAIAAIVSGFGYYFARRTAREQIAQGLSGIRVSLETARQEQLTEVLKKRAETYPHLYAVISDYGRSWTLRGKQRDRNWAEEFLEALLTINARYGVFFSSDVYAAYGSLRDCLVFIIRNFEANTPLKPQEMEEQIYNVIRGENGRPGLGSWLKDDLASYVPPIVSNVHPDIASSAPRRNTSPSSPSSDN